MNQIWFHQQTFHLARISYNDHKSQSYEHQSKIAAKHSEKPINTNICYEYATTHLLKLICFLLTFQRKNYLIHVFNSVGYEIKRS